MNLFHSKNIHPGLINAVSTCMSVSIHPIHPIHRYDPLPVYSSYPALNAPRPGVSPQPRHHFTILQETGPFHVLDDLHIWLWVTLAPFDPHQNSQQMGHPQNMLQGSTDLFIYLSIYLFIYLQSIYLFVYLFTHLHVCLHIIDV